MIGYLEWRDMAWGYIMGLTCCFISSVPKYELRTPQPSAAPLSQRGAL